MCVALALFSACDRQASTRVLFIGNSYTSVNAGLDKQLRGLAPSIETASMNTGGYTLERHWTVGNALNKIESHLPIDEPDNQGLWLASPYHSSAVRKFKIKPLHIRQSCCRHHGSQLSFGI